MAGIGKICAVGDDGGAFGEPGFHAVGKAPPIVRHRGHVREIDFAVGPFDLEQAVHEVDVLRLRLQKIAASALPRAMIFSEALTSAVPPTVMEREAPVPRPKATASVSP